MVGELPPEIAYIIDNKVNGELLPAYLPNTLWTKGRKYEENTLIIDLRQFDPNGSLDQVKELDKSTNRYVPKTEVVSGCLIIRLRREL